MDDMARKNSRPILKFTTPIPAVTGITAKDINTVTMTIAGAIMKTGLSAKGGIQSSFVNIFRMSAKTCNKPKGPARLGP
jgi:hypothetical protein